MLKMSQENLIPLGIVVIFLGFFLIVIGAIMSSRGSKVEWAFGGFIGPMPFGFASREDWLKFIIVLTLIFLFIFILLNRKVIGI